jgi:hypothetical protein
MEVGVDDREDRGLVLCELPVGESGHVVAGGVS